MGILDERANLQGKVAMILGGGDGMGRAITIALAQAGVNLAICDINPIALTQTLELLKPHGAKVFSARVDVRDRAALDTFWTEFDQHFNEVNIVINVVGGVSHKAFLDSTPAEWDDNIQTNFAYVVQSCHHAGTRMRKAGCGGSIVNITTIEAYRSAPGFSVYAGLKAGVANLSRSLGTELAPLGIRVNCVAPDQTPTPGLFTCIDPDTYDPVPVGKSESDIWKLAEEQARNAIPLGRMGQLEDIENCILRLVGLPHWPDLALRRWCHGLCRLA
jgi:3-oxoacyl-[acyl-carrier protein] reductase